MKKNKIKRAKENSEITHGGYVLAVKVYPLAGLQGKALLAVGTPKERIGEFGYLDDIDWMREMEDLCFRKSQQIAKRLGRRFSRNMGIKERQT